MKKSELKALLKIIAEEVIAAKQAQMNETKGLSGMKKAPESTEHTEKVADSKDLTGPAPKEKEEGKKLPVVKKPANPKIVNEVLGEPPPSELSSAVIAGLFSSIGLLAMFVMSKTKGKLPWPWNKLQKHYREEKIVADLKKTEESNKKMEGLHAYAIKRAADLAKDPAFADALQRNDPEEMAALLLKTLSEENASDDDKYWLRQIRDIADTQRGGDPSKTVNLFSLLFQQLAARDKDPQKTTSQRADNLKENQTFSFLLDIVTYYYILSYIIVWAVIKISTKIPTSGDNEKSATTPQKPELKKLPFPFNKLVEYYDETHLRNKIERQELKNRKLQGLTTYCEKRAEKLAADPIMKEALKNNDFREIVRITKDRMSEPYDTEQDKYWAEQSKQMEDDPRGSPEKTVNIFNRVIFSLIKKAKKSSASSSDSQKTVSKDVPSLKQEIIQMIREEIDEMARVKGAVGSKFKVKDVNSPTGWVVMGHKTIPDGTPTEAPKGPYIKKGKYADTAGLPTAPSGSTKKPVSARETELAVADILKYNPNATDEEIAAELASRSENGEPLNLAPSIIAHAIDMTKDAEKSPDSGGDEPAAPDFAAKEKAEKQKKMDRLRSYLMRKRGIKPTE